MSRLMPNQPKRRAQTGDTIVEVMISIVVIAMVLTGSFFVSRASLKNVRDSQEHSEALNLLQGQIEQLRAAAGQSGSAVPTDGSQFCFDSSSVVRPSTNAACQNQGSGQLYNYNIKSTGKDPNTLTTSFVGTVSWPSINSGTDQEQLFYKVAVN